MQFSIIGGYFMAGRPLLGSGGCVAVTVSPNLCHFTCSAAEICAVNRDDFMSRYRMTNFSREKVLRKL